MAKEKSSGGGLLVILAIIIVFIYILVANLFNFKIAVSYDPGQYFANIWHFHSDFYAKATTPFKLYKDILPIAELKHNEPTIHLKSGKRFKFEGYREREHITWVAAKVFKGTNVIYGHFMVPEKIQISTFWSKVPLSKTELVSNKYFREISNESTEAYRDNINKIFKNKLHEIKNIKRVVGGAKIEEINESSRYKIIPYISTDNVGYYCSKQEYQTVEALFKRYQGDNFETHYLQANTRYNSGKEGVFEENPFMKIIGKWYFKIGFPILILLFLKLLFRTREKCPNCGSTDFNIEDKHLLSERYKHEKKDGERDQRYKDNPLINQFQVSMKCNSCGNEWTEELMEETTGEKSKNFSTNINSDPSKDKEIEVEELNIELEEEPSKSFVASDKLRMLKTVFKNGLINKEEYKQKRKMVIDQI